MNRLMTTIVHCRRQSYDVYIGRGSPWGNPFTHLRLNDTLASVQVATREEAIARYEEWVIMQADLMTDLPNLRGLRLGCHCRPLICHGDVLVKLLNGHVEGPYR